MDIAHDSGVVLATIDVSLGDQNTDQYSLRGYSVASIQYDWSGMVGLDSTVEMQTTDSNGKKWDTKAGTNKVIDSEDNSSSLSLAGNATSQAIRFKFTANSATAGTLIIWGTLKG